MDRWLNFLQTYQVRELPGLDVAADWLRRNRPEHYTPGIMHGDYQFANVMYAHGAPARLAAIVDWEMTTIGDPLLDLGWCLLGYDGENPRADGFYLDMAGMPTRSELLAHYEKVSGLSTDEHRLLPGAGQLEARHRAGEDVCRSGQGRQDGFAGRGGDGADDPAADRHRRRTDQGALMGAGNGYADALFDLTDQVVLITGGSRGLGREMAFAAARCGADVVVASRNLDSCEATATEIEAETGRTAMPYAVHVGRWDQLDGLVDAVYDRFGKLDVLVNNAGMSPVYDKQTDVTEKMFDAVVNLNLKGPFRLSALAGERMVAAGGGAIINVSTHGSLRPHPSFIPYAASKAGLNVDDRRPGPRVRAHRPRQHADARAVSDRHQQGLELPGHAQSVRPLRPCSAPAIPTRSSAPRCS